MRLNRASPAGGTQVVCQQVLPLRVLQRCGFADQLGTGVHHIVGINPDIEGIVAGNAFAVPLFTPGFTRVICIRPLIYSELAREVYLSRYMRLRYRQRLLRLFVR
jgi:hypothetical protein